MTFEMTASSPRSLVAPEGAGGYICNIHLEAISITRTKAITPYEVFLEDCKAIAIVDKRSLRDLLFTEAGKRETWNDRFRTKTETCFSRKSN